MNRDILFTGEQEITMYKLLWSDNEISLARCLNLYYNIGDSTIRCDLSVTNKVSIIEFIKESFSRVWHNPSEVEFKESLLQNIDSIYERMYSAFESSFLGILGYQDKLYFHQKDSLFMGHNKQYNFYGLEQGLGKTLVAASVSKMHQIRRTIIICPASLKHNWMMELTGDKSICQFNKMYFSMLDASRSKTFKAFQERFVICNYDSLEKHHEYLTSEPVGHIILDECTDIKNVHSNKFKNVNNIVKANPNAKISLLSGTPVRNRINDLYAYLKLIHHPLGENYSHFIREYTISSKGRGQQLRITGGKNMELLWRQMSNFMIRKRKVDCLDLPEKIYTKLYFSIDDYKDEYDKAVMEALEKSGNTNINSSIHTINIVTSKAKLSGNIEFIERLIEQGEKVVVFSGYTVIIEALEAHFKEKSVVINGSVDSFERSERVKKFMEDDSCMVFIGQHVAAGRGLTLTSSSNVVTMDFPLSHADLEQLIDRTHRIGQTKTVNVTFSIGSDSIDEHIYDLVVGKSADAASVIDNTTSEFTQSNITDVLLSKLREEYSGKAKESVKNNIS